MTDSAVGYSTSHKNLQSPSLYKIYIKELNSGNSALQQNIAVNSYY